MATITFDITVGKGERATTSSHTFDGDDIPLILVEASQTGDAKMLREAIAEFLDLPDNVSRQLTLRNIKQIGAAIKEASDAPNG